MEKKTGNVDRIVLGTRNASAKVKPTLRDRLSVRDLSLFVLRAVSDLLIVLGGLIFLFSLINQRTYPVLGQPIHGSIWGSVIVFLGVRYRGSVSQLCLRMDFARPRSPKGSDVRKVAL